MDRLDRRYKLHQLLAHGRSRTIEDLLEKLEISRATFKRDLRSMRESYGAEIVWDRDTRGYRMASSTGVGRKFELPGLWLNQQELLALATMQQLLSSMDSGGSLAAQLQPLMKMISVKLGHEKEEEQELGKRVKLLSTTTRLNDLEFFEQIGLALVKRIRLDIEYESRGSTRSVSQRVVSPQRFIHYRNNWYLGAWCHSADDIRTFSLDSIMSCLVTKQRAKHLSEKKLAAYYDTGYGIFGGEDRQLAKLKFNAEARRYVENEIWHDDQSSRVDGDGNYLLDVPYVQHQELVMDILRHGADVEVLGPSSLRLEVKRRVVATVGLYR